MNKLFWKTIAAVALFLFAANVIRAQDRFATVDLGKVFSNYWKTKQADAAIKERAADMQKEHKGMADDFDKAKADYQTMLADTDNTALSTAERDKRKKLAEDKLKEIKDKETTITQYDRQAQATIEEQSQRMKDNLLGEIRKVLNAKAKTAGYTQVFDTGAQSVTTTPVVLFNNSENDLTASVLKELNATAPLELPAADETAPKDADGKKKK
jgi:outer membrane protein